MRPTLYFVHHGETQWDREKKFQGPLPGSLTSEGVREVTKRAHTLAQAGVEKVYSSDLPRSIDTANIIQKVCHIPGEVEIWHQLRSLDIGKLNGKSGVKGSSMVNQYATEHPFDKLPGASESFAEWHEQILEATDRLFAEVVKKQLIAAAVTHSICLNLLWADYKAEGGFNNHNIDMRAFTTNDLNSGKDYKATFNGREWTLEKVDLT